MGLFDPVEAQPYAHYNWAHVATPQHQQLALEAAHQSIVLLQNPDTALPLVAGKKLLVAGRYRVTICDLPNHYRESAAPHSSANRALSPAQ